MLFYVQTIEIRFLPLIHGAVSYTYWLVHSTKRQTCDLIMLLSMILMSSVLAACVVKRFRFDLLQFKSTFPLKTGCSIEQILQGSCTSIELF